MGSYGLYESKKEGCVVSLTLIGQIIFNGVIISSVYVLLAVGFSGVVGVVFGMWPAEKAARLDPIQALRFE